jgi:hypothetical protein
VRAIDRVELKGKSRLPREICLTFCNVKPESSSNKCAYLALKLLLAIVFATQLFGRLEHLQHLSSAIGGSLTSVGFVYFRARYQLIQYGCYVGTQISEFAPSHWLRG